MNFEIMIYDLISSLSTLSTLKLIIILIFIIFNFILIILEIKIFKITRINQKVLKSGFLDSQLAKRLKQCGVVITSVATLYSTSLAQKQESVIYDKYKEAYNKYSSEVNELQKSIIDVKITNNNLKLKFYGLNATINEKNQDSIQCLNLLDKLKKEVIEKLAAINTNIDTNEIDKLREELKFITEIQNNYMEKINKNLMEIQKEMLNVETVIGDSSFELTKENSPSTSTDVKQIDQSSVGNIIESIFEYYFSLSTIEKMAFSLLLTSYTIVSLLISIIFMIYGDFLIKKFNLEERYPRLAKIIEIRRKFQRYYIILNFVWIFLLLFAEMLLSIGILFF